MCNNGIYLLRHFVITTCKAPLAQWDTQWPADLAISGFTENINLFQS